MDEVAGGDEHRLACQRASFERFRVVPERVNDVVHDFLREVFPRPGDYRCAQVQQGVEVEVPRFAGIGWILCGHR